jgi:hypothetical protein
LLFGYPGQELAGGVDLECGLCGCHGRRVVALA